MCHEMELTIQPPKAAKWQNEKELTMSQEKLDHIDEQIFEIDDSLKKLGVVNAWTT